MQHFGQTLSGRVHPGKDIPKHCKQKLIQDDLSSLVMEGVRNQKEVGKNKCWRRCGEKGTLLHCWWECKVVQPLWKTVWKILRKLKIELPYDPAIPVLGTYPDKTLIQKDTCTPVFIAALFTIAKAWKQSKCPGNR